jgi:predicted nucleotidyltransferase
MDKTAAIESVRKYAERVQRDFNVNKVILFGSHAKGTAREDSDIDVAVGVASSHDHRGKMPLPQNVTPNK